MTLPKLIVLGDDGGGFTGNSAMDVLLFSRYDTESNTIFWILKYDDPIDYGNIETLIHEYLHWLLEWFINAEASVKLDNIDSWPEQPISSFGRVSEE